MKQSLIVLLIILALQLSWSIFDLRSPLIVQKPYWQLSPRSSVVDNANIELPRSVSRSKIDALYDKMDVIAAHLLKENLFLRPNEIYEVLIKELTPEEAVLKLLIDYDKNREKVDYMIRRFQQTVVKALGKDAFNLLVDPSISSRLDEFIEVSMDFILSNQDIELLELRKYFKDKLSKTKVYRAVFITKKDLEGIRRYGFIANLFRTNQQIEPREVAGAMMSAEFWMNRHAGFANPEGSPLISVSNHPTMALYAAHAAQEDMLEHRDVSGYQWYIFPIEINEYDLIRYSWYLERGRGGAPIGKFKRGQEEISVISPYIEGFAQFRIPPENIIFDEVQIVEQEDGIPEYQWSPQEHIDEFITVTDEAHKFIQNKIHLLDPERFWEFPILGTVSLYSVSNLEKVTGRSLWIGGTKHHPNYEQWHYLSLRKRQPVFVDAKYAYHLAYITGKIYEIIDRPTEINGYL